MTQDIVDKLNLEFAEYGYTGTMDNIVCSEFYEGTQTEEYDMIMTCTFDDACGEYGEESDGSWWKYYCGDNATKLLAAGTATLMLAFTI